MAKIKKGMMVCPNCGFIGKGKMKGSLLVEIVLFLMFILPWVFYYLWRSTQKKSVCPQCGCKDMIPADTPRGQKLVEEYAQTEEPLKQRQNKPPMPKATSYTGRILGWVFGVLLIVLSLPFLLRRARAAGTGFGCYTGKAKASG